MRRACTRSRVRCPELDTAVRHVAGFARMIKNLSGDEDTLAAWMGVVDADLPPLRSFTAGLSPRPGRRGRPG